MYLGADSYIGVNMTDDVVIKSYRVEIQKQIMGNIEDAMNKIGALVEERAKKNASNARDSGTHPYVQTGDMHSAIGYYTHKEGAEIITDVGISEEICSKNGQKFVPYAPSVEFGVFKGGHPHPPYPFLFPAVESSKDEIKEFLKGKSII